MTQSDQPDDADMLAEGLLDDALLAFADDTGISHVMTEEQALDALWQLFGEGRIKVEWRGDEPTIVAAEPVTLQ